MMSTKPSHTTYRKKLANICINALLLLIPSAIFLIVKINTTEDTITWRVENLIFFFLLYVMILSFFTFKPYIYILNTSIVQKSLQKSNAVTSEIVHTSWFKTVFVLLLVGLPWILSLYQVKIFIYVFIFLIFAIGLNYTVGFAGILNLGHVLPFAVGAYTYGLLYKYLNAGFFSGLVAGSIMGLFAGWLISIITIRLNGDYLAIVTLALAEIFKILVNNIGHITGGPRGIPGIPLPTLPFIDISFGKKYILLYYCTVILAFIGIILAHRLVKSRFGRSWEASREDSIAAESMGINLKKTRMTVFTIGGCYAGIAGVFLASSSTYVSPSIVTILYSITVLSIVVLGGMGSIKGVILGTIIVVFLPEYLRSFELYRMLIYGALLVIMMRYRQRGLLPQKRIIYAHEHNKEELT